MKYNKKTNGLTFLEVMVAIVIIGILAAIAIPSYSEYIKRTHLNVAAQKAEHLQMLLQDYWEDNETYVEGGDSVLQTTLGWGSGDANITSKVEAGSSKDIKTSFKITITHAKVDDEDIIIQYSRD
ncbi:MAG: prepilin-type N-terminal cleavage/methylation domain-containing protein [Candidatus Polarisedimenticolaceae bacterium]|nr:prepilin-type N-terminal cleavage/methylation domain-containing protein [Candidatus Polarisedimenticolaceae bacterium]